LRYYAFQTKDKDGKDQVVFVEKYVNSHHIFTTAPNLESRYKNQKAHDEHTKTPNFQALSKNLPELIDRVEVKQGTFLAGYEDRPNL
jgi:quinol monooxygenase YgiN